MSKLICSMQITVLPCKYMSSNQLRVSHPNLDNFFTLLELQDSYNQITQVLGLWDPIGDTEDL